jgi:hypothetical protein
MKILYSCLCLLLLVAGCSSTSHDHPIRVSVQLQQLKAIGDCGATDYQGGQFFYRIYLNNELLAERLSENPVRLPGGNTTTLTESRDLLLYEGDVFHLSGTFWTHLPADSPQSTWELGRFNDLWTQSNGWGVRPLGKQWTREVGTSINCRVSLSYRIIQPASLAVFPRSLIVAAGTKAIKLRAELSNSHEPIVWILEPHKGGGQLSATLGRSVLYTPPATVNIPVITQVVVRAGDLEQAIRITVTP